MMAFAACSAPPRALRNARGPACRRRAPVPYMRAAQDGDRVRVEFCGTFDDGTEFGRTAAGRAVEFTVGGGAVIRGFDAAVRGLRAGESRSVRMPAAQAYGSREAELVAEIPAARVAPAERATMRVGRRVPLDNGLVATVLEVRPNGDVVVDANHELAGKALNFELRLMGFCDRRLPPVADGAARAIFALGSFWAAELAFQRVRGVLSTCVGYVGGAAMDPTYEDVVTGMTGHAEAVAVDYDPEEVSYEGLLNIFWDLLGDRALTKHRSGKDVGSQYRSAVFCANDVELQTAKKSRADVNARLGRSVVTEVAQVAEENFWVAEDIHQRCSRGLYSSHTSQTI